MSNPASNTASILQKNKKVLIASLTGSAIEWFDYFLYGTAAALVFNKIFFPMVDPVIGLILSWLSFSLTFFIRPIGGVIFAHIGDRIGRKKTLVLTLSLMGSATVAIGLLPTYEMVGLWAPALLITLRIIQGMGIGGEWGGALLLAYEYAPEKRKGFFGSIPQAGVTIGMLMATFIVSLMTLFDEAQFLAWGWRIPFLLSSVLVFLGLWIRKDIDETPAFKQVKQSGQVAKAPLRETLKHHWREVLIAAGLKVVETAPFYIFSTFVVSYATTTLSYQKSQALESVTLGALVATVMIPLMGLLSDKVGRQKKVHPERGAAGAVYRPVVSAARHRHQLGHYAGDDRCLRHPVGAGDRGAGHPVLRDFQRQCALYRNHPRLPAGRRAGRGHRAAYRHRSAGEIRW